MSSTADRTGSAASTGRRGDRSRPLLLIIALLVLLATACVPTTQPVAGSTPSVAAGTPQQPSDSPSPDDTDDGSTTADPSDAPTRPDVDCDGQVDALDTVITAQLTAFAAGDWDAAWALTSSRFRAAGVDADGLREIVESGYAVAADAADHRIVACVLDGNEAQVLIDITATDGRTLQLIYLLTREDGGWRISGAVEHGLPASEPATIPA